jgi:hypothetical protein
VPHTVCVMTWAEAEITVSAIGDLTPAGLPGNRREA